VAASLCTERVAGIDFSAGMLAEAALASRRRWERGGGARARDVLTMSLDRAFDVVVSTGAFGHILERTPLLLGTSSAPSVPEAASSFHGGASLSALAGFWMDTLQRRDARPQRPLRAAFVMYYLTMLWPRSREARRRGFDVEVRRAVFPKPFTAGMLVVATRRG